MDKETKALIDFYKNQIKDLKEQNKEKQDKLDEIEKYMIGTNNTFYDKCENLPTGSQMLMIYEMPKE